MNETGKKLRILFVVAGLPADGGGFSVIVPSMAMAFQRQGAHVTIATRAGKEPLSVQAEEAERSGVRIVRFRPSFPSCAYFSWQMLRGLGKLVEDSDIVYIHGQWTFPVWHAGHCALRAKKTLVMRPAGSFNPVQLAHSKFRKKLASLFDYPVLRRADAIQVSSETEKEWTLGVPGMKSRADRIFVARHGVEMPDESLLREEANPHCRSMLYLGRIHPMKGLDLLLDAMKIVLDRCESPDAPMPRCPDAPTPRRPDAPMPRLVICGPDENGTRAALEKQVEKNGLGEYVSFAEPVFGDAKWKLMSAADCVVLPSRSENFGIVVAEALACGKPVICTKGAPWECLEATGAKAGWWTEISAEGLADAICGMCAKSDGELASMGRAGHAYAVRELSWDSAVKRILEKIWRITGKEARDAL